MLLPLAQKATHRLPSRPTRIDETGKANDGPHPARDGLAVAVIDRGKVGFVQAYGIRNAKGEPSQRIRLCTALQLIKMVFAYHVMQLVDQGKIKLARPSKPILIYR